MASSVSRWFANLSASSHNHSGTAGSHHHGAAAAASLAGQQPWRPAPDDNSPNDEDEDISSSQRDTSSSQPEDCCVSPMTANSLALAAQTPHRPNAYRQHKATKHTVPLSAQSTLESLSIHHAGLNGRSAAALLSGTQHHHNHAVVRRSPSSLSHGSPSSAASSSAVAAATLSTLSSHNADGSSAAACFTGYASSVAAATAASLAPLFACISPYLSPADVRHNIPLKRLYDNRGPVVFPFPPLDGLQLHRGELRLWSNEAERIVSQNSSNRRVHRSMWISSADPHCPRPAALKFVEDANPRDGRSLKREIECHIYVYQKLPCLFQLEQELRTSQQSCGLSFVNDPEWSVTERLEDAWPSAELFGYHLDKKNPGKSVLLTRKLSGPDLFDVIRAEHNHNWHFHHPSNAASSGHKCRAIYSHRLPTKRKVALQSSRNSSGSGSGYFDSCAYYPLNYEYHKLRWCALALKRIAQYASLSIRHNDVKPDNIVLDFYTSRAGHECLDVKLIDLGTASMHNAKDFTGGTSWYESPEQKLLEYFMKRKKKPEAAKRVEIDLPSDLWGAGISLAEILIGRRVVDTLKAPHGPGSLEYLGWEAATTRGHGRFNTEETAAGAASALTFEGECRGFGGHVSNYPFWAVDPDDWTLCAHKALGLDRENTTDKLTVEAAKWIFTHLVRPAPETRTPITIAMAKMERFADEAYKRYRYLTNSFERPSNSNCPTTSSSRHYGGSSISPAETTCASTPATMAIAAQLNSTPQVSYRQHILNAVTPKLASPKHYRKEGGANDNTNTLRSLLTPQSNNAASSTSLWLNERAAATQRNNCCLHPPNPYIP